MGANSSTNRIHVEITPQFYDKNGKDMNDIVYKKNPLYPLCFNDIEYLFSHGSKVESHRIVDNTLVYDVRIQPTTFSKIRNYVKDAWKKFTNAGDPIKATFVKGDSVFFRVGKVFVSNK